MDFEWQRLAQLEQPAVIATVVRVAGSAPREPGARMLVFPDGRLEGTLGGGRLEQRVCAEARALLDEGRPHAFRTYRLNPSEDQCCGGEVDVFLERLAPAPRVLLFGAGHVGQAVARALAPLPFRVTVVDARAEYATRERFPEAHHDVVCAEPVEGLGRLSFIPEQTYALIFTHSHKLDLLLVSLLLARPLRYLGLIGSRTKWARFRSALLERGFSEADLARVTCPVGIGVGGKQPEEIAVSVVAQLLAVRDGLVVEAHKLSELPPGTRVEPAPEASA